MHSVTERQTDSRMMPIADHTVYIAARSDKKGTDSFVGFRNGVYRPIPARPTCSFWCVETTTTPALYEVLIFLILDNTH